MTGEIPAQPSQNAAKTVAVVGTNPLRHKFGNKSVRAHLETGWQVFPVHPRETRVENLPVYRTVEDIPVEKLDRITVYVPPEIGMGLLAGFARKSPGEVWFNPGSANEELIQKAESLGLPVIQACSIVDVGKSPSQYR